MSYRLDDVALRHREYPDGFSIPRADVRYNLPIGEIVSIGFVAENGDANNPEWVWTRVDVAREGGRYIGVLLDDPKTVPSLKSGNRIEFTADNMWEIYIEEGDARWIDQSKLAMVSGHVANEAAYPGRLMRIPPMAPEYSGWLIYSGQEPPEYVRDFGNFVSKRLDEMLSRYPNLDQVLAGPIGSTWNWDPETAEYTA
ncbi:MAG: immunity protein Imm33 domain-containing protein [Terriglobales bacterium]